MRLLVGDVLQGVDVTTLVARAVAWSKGGFPLQALAELSQALQQISDARHVRSMRVLRTRELVWPRWLLPALTEPDCTC